jgi:hypothetical protein
MQDSNVESVGKRSSVYRSLAILLAHLRLVPSPFPVHLKLTLLPSSCLLNLNGLKSHNPACIIVCFVTMYNTVESRLSEVIRTGVNLDDRT